MALQPPDSIHLYIYHAVYVYQTDLKNKQNIIIKQDLGLRLLCDGLRVNNKDTNSL